MVSLSKILMTAAVIYAVWHFVRWFNRPTARAEPKRQGRRNAPAETGLVEELIACGACGEYATAGAAPCDRGDCPRR